MQIHDRLNQPPLSNVRRGSDKPGAADERGKAQEAALPASTSLEGSVLRELQGQPDLRPDVISAAKARLESGEYLTRQAAEATARALLGGE